MPHGSKAVEELIAEAKLRASLVEAFEELIKVFKAPELAFEAEFFPSIIAALSSRGLPFRGASEHSVHLSAVDRLSSYESPTDAAKTESSTVTELATVRSTSVKLGAKTLPGALTKKTSQAVAMQLRHVTEDLMQHAGHSKSGDIVIPMAASTTPAPKAEASSWFQSVMGVAVKSAALFFAVGYGVMGLNILSVIPILSWAIVLVLFIAPASASANYALIKKTMTTVGSEVSTQLAKIRPSSLIAYPKVEKTVLAILALICARFISLTGGALVHATVKRGSISILAKIAASIAENAVMQKAIAIFASTMGALRGAFLGITILNLLVSTLPDIKEKLLSRDLSMREKALIITNIIIAALVTAWFYQGVKDHIYESVTDRNTMLYVMGGAYLTEVDAGLSSAVNLAATFNNFYKTLDVFTGVGRPRSRDIPLLILAAVSAGGGAMQGIGPDSSIVNSIGQVLTASVINAKFLLELYEVTPYVENEKIYEECKVLVSLFRTLAASYAPEHKGAKIFNTFADYYQALVDIKAESTAEHISLPKKTACCWRATAAQLLVAPKARIVSEASTARLRMLESDASQPAVE
jgi:hypothetical protein